MTLSRLDKWIKEVPEPSKYIHIFINGVELTTEFDSRLALRALEALKSGRVGQTNTLGSSNNP